MIKNLKKMPRENKYNNENDEKTNIIKKHYTVIQHSAKGIGQ